MYLEEQLERYLRVSLRTGRRDDETSPNCRFGLSKRNCGRLEKENVGWFFEMRMNEGKFERGVGNWVMAHLTETGFQRQS